MHQNEQKPWAVKDKFSNSLCIGINIEFSDIAFQKKTRLKKKYVIVTWILGEAPILFLVRY